MGRGESTTAECHSKTLTKACLIWETYSVAWVVEWAAWAEWEEWVEWVEWATWDRSSKCLWGRTAWEARAPTIFSLHLHKEPEEAAAAGEECHLTSAKWEDKVVEEAEVVG